MYRFIAVIAMFLLLVQGCTIADVPYHRVCGIDTTCSAEALTHAVSKRTDLAIHNDGWGACLDDAGHDKLDHSSLAQHSRCDNFDRSSLLPVSYSQAWLEYRDVGLRHDPAQIDAILRWIQAGSGPLYVVVYIHGWHHNADESNGDPRNNAIKFPFLMARQVDMLKRMALDGRSPMPQVLGIYVGWRGEAYTDPVRKLFSIDDRSKAADAIGNAGVLKSDLLAIANATRARDTSASRMVVIGHSLGGRMATSMFKQDLEAGQPQPLGSGTLVVTLNAAVGADCFDGVFKEGGKNPNAPRPTWINLTSEDDTATDGIYSTAKRFGFLHDGGDDIHDVLLDLLEQVLHGLARWLAVICVQVLQILNVRGVLDFSDWHSDQPLRAGSASDSLHGPLYWEPPMRNERAPAPSAHPAIAMAERTERHRYRAL